MLGYRYQPAKRSERPYWVFQRRSIRFRIDAFYISLIPTESKMFPAFDPVFPELQEAASANGRFYVNRSWRHFRCTTRNRPSLLSSTTCQSLLRFIPKPYKSGTDCRQQTVQLSRNSQQLSSSLHKQQFIQDFYWFNRFYSKRTAVPSSIRSTIQSQKDSLRKHAYSNIVKNLPPKNENFQIKILIFFIFLLKT